MSRRYDVIIVGAGPAGIFAALELSQAKGASVLLLEKGQDINGRVCPATSKVNVCPPLGILSGSIRCLFLRKSAYINSRGQI